MSRRYQSMLIHSSSDSALGAFGFHNLDGMGWIGFCNRFSSPMLVYQAVPVTATINLQSYGAHSWCFLLVYSCTPRSSNYQHQRRYRKNTVEASESHPKHITVLRFQCCGSGHHPPYGVQISTGRSQISQTTKNSVRRNYLFENRNQNASNIPRPDMQRYRPGSRCAPFG